MNWNRIKISLTFACVLTLTSCAPDINLPGFGPAPTPEYKHLVDPGRITVRIWLQKGPNLFPPAPISVSLGGPLIEGGGISVNGQRMEETCAFGIGFLFVPAPRHCSAYYTVPNEPVANKQYKFTFTFSDKSTYETSINTQGLKVPNLPESHNPNNDLEMGWQQVEPKCPLTLDMFTNTSPGLQTSMQLPDSCLSSGRCTLPSSFFSSGFHSRAADEVSLSITSVKSGKLDGVGPGSKFISTFRIEKKLRLNHN